MFGTVIGLFILAMLQTGLVVLRREPGLDSTSPSAPASPPPFYLDQFRLRLRQRPRAGRPDLSGGVNVAPTTILSGVTMIALFAAAASGCGSSGSPRPAPAAPSAPPAKPRLIVGTKSDNFYVTMDAAPRPGGRQARGAHHRHRRRRLHRARADRSSTRRSRQSRTPSWRPPGPHLGARHGSPAGAEQRTRIVFVDTWSSSTSSASSRSPRRRRGRQARGRARLATLIGGKGSVAVFITVKAGTSPPPTRASGLHRRDRGRVPEHQAAAHATTTPTTHHGRRHRRRR